MAMDENKLSMYLAGTLKVIFDGLNSTLSHGGTNYTLVSYDGHDFIRESIGADGKIDESLLSRNIGKTVDCSPFMRDKLISEFERARVTFAAVETVEPTRDGGVANWCYFATHKSDRDKVDHIITDLNMMKGEQQMEPSAFLSYTTEKNIPIRGVQGVEPEVYETMLKEKNLDFPFCAIKNAYGSYDIRMPEQEKHKLHDAIVKAVILCSAHTRTRIIERSRYRREQINDAVSKIMDSRKAFVIMDGKSPDHYIRTDSSGFHNIVRTAAGDQELDFVERTSPNYQTKAYNVLHDYGSFEKLVATDKDIEQQMQMVRDKFGRQKEPDIEVKIEYYKRSLSEHIKESIERDYLGRLKDNEVKFHAAIDHAVVMKDDTQKGDLEGDLQLNGRALKGVVKETSIDLSDLNGEAFSQQFCETVLGTRAEEDLDARLLLEDEIRTNVGLRELSEESPEIKQAVINEIRQTMEEVRTIDYEITVLDRGEFALEVESKENAFMEISTDERDM